MPRTGRSSLRDRSFSRLATEEAARLLEAMGAETRIFHPRGLPLPDGEDASHPKVQELVKFTLLTRDRIKSTALGHGSAFVMAVAVRDIESGGRRHRH